MVRLVALSFGLILCSTVRSQDVQTNEDSLHHALQRLAQRHQFLLFFDSAWTHYFRPVDSTHEGWPLEMTLDSYSANQLFICSLARGSIHVFPRNLKGKVINEHGEPLSEVCVKSKSDIAFTDTKGQFELTRSAVDPFIDLSRVSMKPLRVPIAGTTNVIITMRPKQMPPFYCTGYGQVDKSKATGSYGEVNSIKLNRRVSTGFLERLEGNASGVIFARNISPDANQSRLSIRGISTIYANPNPLIVLDNFPYEGDIRSINPNDIESVTILKDAASTSIYGTLSSNGVIVIATQKSKYEQRLRIKLNINCTLAERPDLWYLPQMSTLQYIEAEEFLFDAGFYDVAINNPYTIISPVVQILDKKRNGFINEWEAAAMLDQLRKRDVRKDYYQSYYRPAFTFQHALNLSGGTRNIAYYLSAGFDKTSTSRIGSFQRRITFLYNTTARLANWVELNSTSRVAFLTLKNDNPIPTVLYPYAQLKDSTGKPAVSEADIRQSYKEQLPLMADWNYRPLEEFSLQNKKYAGTCVRASVGLKLKPIKNGYVEFMYGTDRETANELDLHSTETYYTRNLVNTFTGLQNGVPVYHVPNGDIGDYRNSMFNAVSLRIQSCYAFQLMKSVKLEVIGGFEKRFLKTDTSSYRKYRPVNGRTGRQIDFRNPVPLFYDPTRKAYIPDNSYNSEKQDDYMSCYLNIECSLRELLTVTASGRLDKSNYFGQRTNQKPLPLWSAGVAWNIRNEQKDSAGAISLLRLRTNFGFNGNVNKTIIPQAIGDSGGINRYGLPFVSIINPNNPGLRWEKTGQLSIGVELATREKKFELIAEYYYRWSTHLVGEGRYDPTTGFGIYRGNSAALKGQGFDITIRASQNLGIISLYTNCYASYVTDKVTDYNSPVMKTWLYTDGRYLTPREGWPVHAVASYRWKGLDGKGNPIGYLKGIESQDYSAIVESIPDDLVLAGRATPAVFASLQQAVRLGKLEISLLLTGRFGYYFKQSSINYSELIGSLNWGHSDFGKRWQEPGDELITSVPSFAIADFPDRDKFYTNSEVHVERGDHIRLQDIRINYYIKEEINPDQRVKSLVLYAYVNNLGVLWKSADIPTDPDYIREIPSPRSISLGINISF